MKTVSFADLSGDVAIDAEDKYFVHVPDHSHFIIITLGLYPKASSRFDHPNVVAWQDDSFETRAYWPSGRKKWFSHAGRAFYFVVPRERISLIYEKGYSWVPVEINGCKFHFNVSGGTRRGGGWSDGLRQRMHVSAGLPIKTMKLLAEAALPLNEARDVISMDLMEISPEHAKTFNNIVTSQVCRAKLRTGHQIVPHEGCSWPQQPDKFILDRKGRGQHYLCRGSSTNQMLSYRVSYNDIDWLLTAQANQFSFQMAERDNRIGPIVPYHDAYSQAS